MIHKQYSYIFPEKDPGKFCRKITEFFWKLYFSYFDGNFISQSISILALILIIDQSFQITHKMMEGIGLLSTEFMFYVCTIMY